MAKAAHHIMDDTLLSDTTLIPSHIAIVMDGNGRWAQLRKQPRLFGHKAGVKSVRTVVETAREIGVRHLTLYAFSTENWRRPSLEVKGLMSLLDTYLKSEQKTMLKNNIRLQCVGQQDKLPPQVRKTLAKIIDTTAHCSAMTLNLALSYGSRSEIIRAVRELTDKCVAGELSSAELDEEMLSAHLYTAGQPDPDLFIRTGGEKRLSNFLLWQVSYTELYFTDIKWPDFGRKELLEAIAEYGSRQRRFGKTGSQVLQE